MLVSGPVSGGREGGGKEAFWLRLKAQNNGGISMPFSYGWVRCCPLKRFMGGGFKRLIVKKINTIYRLYFWVICNVKGSFFNGIFYLFIKLDSNKNSVLDKYDVHIFGKIFAIPHKNECQGW